MLHRLIHVLVDGCLVQHLWWCTRLHRDQVCINLASEAVLMPQCLCAPSAPKTYSCCFLWSAGLTLMEVGHSAVGK